MKLMTFRNSNLNDIEIAFNNWAEDKPLTRDVIIHTCYANSDIPQYGELVITVYYDEKLHPDW